MSIYCIKHVPSEEKDKLLSFLDNHWKKGHSLVVSEELLDFQHKNAKDHTYNFIVGENTITGEYDALVGYIPTSQFDEDLQNNGDYWGAIWKIRDDVSNGEINNVGYYVWKQLFKLPHFQSYAAIGISSIAKRIYEASRMNIGYLSHYYLLNERFNNFRIAQNVMRSNGSVRSKNSHDFKMVWLGVEELKGLQVQPVYRPFKSIAYLINKYAKHPVYKYCFWGVYNGDNLTSIWVVRKIKINGSKIIRVVDVLGRLEGHLYEQLQSILEAENAEYVDLLNYGINKDVFEEMGFSLLDFEGDLIIPNYFEPFESHNVKIELAFKAKYDEYVAFKGDSDQDRPNIIPANCNE